MLKIEAGTVFYKMLCLQRKSALMKNDAEKETCNEHI